MKRMALVTVLLLLALGSGWTQEANSQRGAVSLQVGGSLVAPAGVELEFLLGSVGLSVETRLLVWKLSGDWSGILEPGLNLRFYAGGPDGSLFFFAGVSFLTFWPFSPFSLEQGIVKPRAGLGYNWLLGAEDRWRVGLEVGAAWLQELIEGDAYDISFPLVPHALLILGRTF
jgi:hypothetical protein